MILSLGEVEAYSLRAARGAGMPWGIAQEAAMASRWLAARSLPATSLLAKLLLENDQRAYADMAPTISETVWQSRSASMCPLCAGAALSDRIDMILADHAPLHLRAVAYPLLLAPFLRQTSVATNTAENPCLELRWSDTRVIVSADRLYIDAGGSALPFYSSAHDVTVTTSTGPDHTTPQASHSSSLHTDESSWQTLNRLAQRTYVAESERSRALGAG